MSELKTWSPNADLNRLAPPNGFPWSQEFDEVARSSREVMAAIARYQSSLSSISTTGADGAYALTVSEQITALLNGDRFIFKANHESPAIGNTLAINGLAAVALIFPQGGAIGAADILAGGIYEVVFDGTDLRIIGGLSAGAGATILNSQIPIDEITPDKFDIITGLTTFLEAPTLPIARQELAALTSGQALVGLQVAGSPGVNTIFRPAGTESVLYMIIGAGAGCGGQQTTNGWGGGGGQAGALLFGRVALTSGSSDAVIGAPGANGANDLTAPVAGTDGGDTTYEGSTAGGGEGGVAGTSTAGGAGGSTLAAITLAGTHVGGGIVGDPGQAGAQFDTVTGTGGGLRQALAAGYGGVGSFLARGRGGGGAPGAVKQVPGNGFGLFLFFG